MGGCLRPDEEEIEDKSQGEAWQGEPVGEPEVFGVEHSQCCEQPGEDRVSEDFGQGVRFGMGYSVGCGREEGIAEMEPAAGPEDADGEFEKRIAEADPGAALAAATAQQEPAQEWDILPPCEGVSAITAMGSGRGDALVLGQAGYQHVEKAAEGESEERCEDGSDELYFVGDKESRSFADDADGGEPCSVRALRLRHRRRLQYCYAAHPRPHDTG